MAEGGQIQYFSQLNHVSEQGSFGAFLFYSSLLLLVLFLFFVCLEFQIIRFVSSTFILLFFIENSFVLLPPSPDGMLCC